jgi:hypothetical protein
VPTVTAIFIFSSGVEWRPSLGILTPDKILVPAIEVPALPRLHHFTSPSAGITLREIFADLLERLLPGVREFYRGKSRLLLGWD